MSIIEDIREWRRKQEIKRINKRRRQIHSIVAEIRKEKNNGRLRRLLFKFPGVVNITTESGGFKEAYCSARLESGHEFTGWGLFAKDAIRNCAAKLARYLTGK